jgi:hypothetical protein
MKWVRAVAMLVAILMFAAAFAAINLISVA